MKLNFRFFDNKKDQTLIFLHGVLGNFRNLSRIPKYPPLFSNFNIYLLDLRNHGNSFHSSDNSVISHASDIHEFILDQNVINPHLIGHSFGGKVSIEMSLRYPTLVRSLVLLDIGPNSLKNEDYRYGEVYQYVRKLKEVDLQRPTSQIEQDIFKIAKGDSALTAFFMTNLNKKSENSNFWRINIDAIFEGFSDIYQHEYCSGIYKGPVLAIAGTKSKYVKQEDLKYWNSYFSAFDANTDVHFIDSGHMVHQEQPQLVERYIAEFYKKNGFLNKDTEGWNKYT